MITAMMDNEKVLFPGYENDCLSYSKMFDMVNYFISYEAWTLCSRQFMEFI